MTTYNFAINQAAATVIGQPYFDIMTEYINTKVIEITFLNTAVTYLCPALSRSINVEVQSTYYNMLPDNPKDPLSSSTVGTAWSLVPILPIYPNGCLRRSQLSNTAGAGVIWTFVRGITLIPNAAGLVIWAAYAPWGQTQTACQVNFCVDE